FTGASAVSFGGVAAWDFTVLSDNALTAAAPAGAAGTVDVAVTTPTGTSSTSAADQFTYTAVPAPTITGLGTSSGGSGGGTVVTINGTNFTTVTSVYFGGVSASFWLVSTTQIQAIAPPDAAGTYDVTVTNPGATSALSGSDRYSYSAAPAPAVT